MSNKQRCWTGEEVERAKALRARKLTYKEIGLILHRSVESVEGVFSRLKRGKKLRTLRMAAESEFGDGGAYWNWQKQGDDAFQAAMRAAPECPK